MNVFFVLLILIILFSVYIFNRPGFFNKFALYPYNIIYRHEYYRLITSGFIHADVFHLLFNLIALYSFGNAMILKKVISGTPHRQALFVVLLFLVAVLISSIVSTFLYKNDSSYRAVGASGGVMGIVFADIVLNPGAMLYVFVFPMPSWLFGIAFLLFSFYGAKRQLGNIGHAAHLSGAVLGIVTGVFLRLG